MSRPPALCTKADIKPTPLPGRVSVRGPLAGRVAAATTPTAGWRIDDALGTHKPRDTHGLEWQEEDHDGKTEPREQTPRTSPGEAGQEALEKARRYSSCEPARRTRTRRARVTQRGAPRGWADY